MERKPVGYWTYDKVMEVAKQCTTKGEFWQHRDAYSAAQRAGWLKEMDWLQSKRECKDPERAAKMKVWRDKKRAKERSGITKDMTDYFECKVTDAAPIPDEDMPEWNYRILIPQMAEDMGFAYARAMRREWSRRGNDNFIIVVTAGKIHKGQLKYKCELYQLRLTEEKRKEFAEVAASIIKDNKEE